VQLKNLPLLLQAIQFISAAFESSLPIKYVKTRTGMCGLLSCRISLYGPNGPSVIINIA